MSRLPVPGGDNGDWGDILNAFLEVSHNQDGTLANNTVGTNQLQSSAVTNAQLDNSTQTAITLANSAVQSVNGKTGSSITLAASDVSAVPSSELGAASGVAQLDGSATLETAQLPSSVVFDSSEDGPSADQVPIYTGVGRETLPGSPGGGSNFMGSWAALNFDTSAVTLTADSAYYNIPASLMSVSQQSDDDNFSVDPDNGLITAKAGWFQMRGIMQPPPSVTLDPTSLATRYIWFYADVGTLQPFQSMGADGVAPVDPVADASGMYIGFGSSPGYCAAGDQVLGESNVAGFGFITAAAGDSLADPGANCLFGVPGPDQASSVLIYQVA